MKPINSPADFETLLQSEQAVVLVFFPWSDRAVESQAVVQEWENNLDAPPAQNNPTVYQLSPNEHSYTWKWLNEALGDSEETFNGSVLWLKHGSVVGCVTDAAVAGVKVLSRMTNDCFVRGKTYSGCESDGLPNGAVAFDSELLQILCCPETHQKLKLAALPLLERINQHIVAGHLQNRSGQNIQDRIDGGLVRADGRYLYPLRQNIPILLVDEAIPLAGY